MDNETAIETYKKHMPELTPEIIKKYICENATDQEVYFFIQLCKAQNLNPFLRESYLIKFGTAPATMVVGKETFTKRADKIKAYDGSRAGVIIAANNEISYRDGSFVQVGERLLGGWAEVFRKDRRNTTRIEVTLSEYEGKTKDGQTTKQWRERPATMIRKVALVQALREAFPDEFASMYSEEEAVTAVPQREQEGRPEIPVIKQVNSDREEDIPAKEGPKTTPIEQEPPQSAPQEGIVMGDSTPPQHGTIHAILKRMGVTDEFDKHDKVSKIIGLGRTVTTFKELTKKQASDAIAKLGAEERNA